MAATTHSALLLLGLIAICSAAVTRQQKVDTVGGFNKNVLIGRGLATQRRGFYNNGCNLEKCWDDFYAEAFNDIPSCNTAMEDLKTCVSTGLTSEGLCTCNFHQVESSLANMNDKMCTSLHNTNWGRCADDTAQACVDKMMALGEKMMQSNADISAEDKQTAYKEMDQCVKEVMNGGVDTTGCEYMFPKGEDDLSYAIGLITIQGWAEGCDEVSHITALCPSPLAESAEHCSDETDVVDKFVQCAQRELTSAPCQTFLSTATEMLYKVKDAACIKIGQIQKKIDETCGQEGRKRTLLKRLLNLLQSHK